MRNRTTVGTPVSRFLRTARMSPLRHLNQGSYAWVRVSAIDRISRSVYQVWKGCDLVFAPALVCRQVVGNAVGSPLGVQERAIW